MVQVDPCGHSHGRHVVVPRRHAAREHVCEGPPAEPPRPPGQRGVRQALPPPPGLGAAANCSLAQRPGGALHRVRGHRAVDGGRVPDPHRAARARPHGAAALVGGAGVGGEQGEHGHVEAAGGGQRGGVHHHPRPAGGGGARGLGCGAAHPERERLPLRAAGEDRGLEDRPRLPAARGQAGARRARARRDAAAPRVEARPARGLRRGGPLGAHGAGDGVQGVRGPDQVPPHGLLREALRQFRGGPLRREGALPGLQRPGRRRPAVHAGHVLTTQEEEDLRALGRLHAHASHPRPPPPGERGLRHPQQREGRLVRVADAR
mmetsp:Transcript_72597/g.205250  ORF Transcript_72597/g.205250 Transcript_72597/m.205250 type:complete len:319 (+) Transcript_72597:127-1083(+)